MIKNIISAVLCFLLLIASAVMCLAATTTLSNSDLSVTIDSSTCKIQVVDIATSKTWIQSNPGRICSALSGDGTTATWWIYPANGAQSYGLTGFIVTATLSGKSLEVTLAENSQQLTNDYVFQYPAGFLTSAGDSMVVPWNEGMIVPVENTTVLNPGGSNFFRFYTGYFTSLPMVGVTNGSSGYMMIVETPYDASMYLLTDSSRVYPLVNWEAQKGYVGYDRKVKYYFYGSGFNHVTMASLFRTWANDNGFVKTLAQKQAENAKISKIIGAFEHYSNDKEIQDSGYLVSAGVSKAIVADGDYTYYSASDASTVRGNNFLTSAYIIFNDSWTSASSCSHRGNYNPGTSTQTGYGIVKKSGYTGPSTEANTTYWQKSSYNSVACGAVPGLGEAFAVSRRFAYEALQSDTNNKMVKNLDATIYGTGRLDAIMDDTETATALLQDYDPNHLQTRSDDAYYRQQILQYHKTTGFVTGSESGQWWSVPYLDFLDGMWTLTNTPGWVVNPSSSTNSSTYQTAYTYRIPLWELIYHDCVLSYNRWDERFEQFMPTSTEMTKKKLWFKLYGMMPLTRDLNTGIDYQNSVFPAVADIASVSSQVAGAKMTNHEFLNGSYSQQRTTWDNGKIITVDFDLGTVSVTSGGSGGGAGLSGGKVSGGKFN